MAFWFLKGQFMDHPMTLSWLLIWWWQKWCSWHTIEEHIPAQFIRIFWTQVHQPLSCHGQPFCMLDVVVQLSCCSSINRHIFPWFLSEWADLTTFPTQTSLYQHGEGGSLFIHLSLCDVIFFQPSHHGPVAQHEVFWHFISQTKRMKLDLPPAPYISVSLVSENLIQPDP